MNIKFTPSIRNTVLGGVAALAVTGGVLVGCQNNTKSDNTKLEHSLETLSNMNKTNVNNISNLDSINSTSDIDSIKAQKIKEGLENIERNRILTDSIINSRLMNYNIK